MDKKILVKLDQALTASVRKSLKGQSEAAVIFSGGIDSSLVAFTAHRLGIKITAFTLGTTRAVDLNFIETIKDKLPFKVVPILISKSKLKKAIPQVVKLLKQSQIETNLTQLSLAVALFLTLEKINQYNFNPVLSGQGADELFAGYYKFISLPPKAINRRCRKEFNRAKKIDLVRDQKIAAHFNIDLNSPYFDPKIADLALNLAPQLKIRKRNNRLIVKYVLRKLGQKIGLPEEIIKRPKKSFQYSTGIQKEIEKLSKNQKKEIGNQDLGK